MINYDDYNEFFHHIGSIGPPTKEMSNKHMKEIYRQHF